MQQDLDRMKFHKRRKRRIFIVLIVTFVAGIALAALKSCYADGAPESSRAAETLLTMDSQRGR